MEYTNEMKDINMNYIVDDLKRRLQEVIPQLSLPEQVEVINNLREAIHEFSPFRQEPVDFVKWVKNENIVANDYNPNKVAPPEMELLEISIINDGYTQPIVTWPNKDHIEVIDGFHRNRVGKESKLVNQRIQGFLPTVIIRKEREDKNDRIASTIRHNRARGKHQVDAMSEIVIELKNRNWKNARIARELGMDEEEVLRLCQISGLEHLFGDQDFSRAWESSDYVETYEAITDQMSDEEIEMYRTANTDDPDRIFHTYDKWECHKAGFYKGSKPGWSAEDCENEYIRILTDIELFESALNRVVTEWKHSCEHYLTNKAMNRIAWLGQASVCLLSGVPSKFCSAWGKLSIEEQNEANKKAHEYLNKWLVANDREEISLEEGLSLGRQVEIY